MSHARKQDGQPILRPPTAWRRLVRASEARWTARQREEGNEPSPRPSAPRSHGARGPVIETPAAFRTGSLAHWRHKRLMRRRAAEARARVEAISRHIDETAPLTHYDKNL